jgi:hypothetical protein
MIDERPDLMPRAKIPDRLFAVPVQLERVSLEDWRREKLANYLGIQSLSGECAGNIEHLIAIYKSTTQINPSSIQGVIVVLRRLYGNLRGENYQDALNIVSDSRSRVDYETQATLAPIAQRVLRGDTGAEDELAAAARTRESELAGMRVSAQAEKLRMLCGMLRHAFIQYANPTHTSNSDSMTYLRGFASEILSFLEVDRDFATHPGRFDEYLRTDVSPLEPSSSLLSDVPCIRWTPSE